MPEVRDDLTAAKDAYQAMYNWRLHEDEGFAVFIDNEDNEYFQVPISVYLEVDNALYNTFSYGAMWAMFGSEED